MPNHISNNTITVRIDIVCNIREAYHFRLIFQLQIDSIGQTIKKHALITPNRIAMATFTAFITTTTPTLILAPIRKVNGRCFKQRHAFKQRSRGIIC